MKKNSPGKKKKLLKPHKKLKTLRLIYIGSSLAACFVVIFAVFLYNNVQNLQFGLFQSKIQRDGVLGTTTATAWNPSYNSCSGTAGKDRHDTYIPTAFGCATSGWVDKGDNCQSSCTLDVLQEKLTNPKETETYDPAVWKLIAHCKNAPGTNKTNTQGACVEKSLTWFTADVDRYGTGAYHSGCGRKVMVTNPKTKISVVALVTDQGPACSVENGEGPKMDLSYDTFKTLKFKDDFHADVAQVKLLSNKDPLAKLGKVIKCEEKKGTCVSPTITYINNNHDNPVAKYHNVTGKIQAPQYECANPTAICFVQITPTPKIYPTVDKTGCASGLKNTTNYAINNQYEKRFASCDTIPGNHMVHAHQNKNGTQTCVDINPTDSRGRHKDAPGVCGVPIAPPACAGTSTVQDCNHYGSHALLTESYNPSTLKLQCSHTIVPGKCGSTCQDNGGTCMRMRTNQCNINCTTQKAGACMGSTFSTGNAKAQWCSSGTVCCY